LGRWEPNCYKNSDAAYDILRQISDAVSAPILLILADPSSTKIPSDLRNCVYAIGFPDDNELIDIMKEVDLGISVSLWEGFNLPIAEMQWMGRSVLGFLMSEHIVR